MRRTPAMRLRLSIRPNWLRGMKSAPHHTNASNYDRSFLRFLLNICVRLIRHAECDFYEELLYDMSIIIAHMPNKFGYLFAKQRSKLHATPTYIRT